MNHNFFFTLTSILVNYYQDAHDEFLTAQVNMTPNYIISTLAGISEGRELLEIYWCDGDSHVEVSLLDTECKRKFSHKFSVHDVVNYPHSTAKDIWLIFSS